MMLIDDYTRLNWVSFLNEKDEVFYKFNVFKGLVENQTNCKLKLLRSSKSKEFTSRESNEFYEGNELITQFSIAKNP